MKDASQEMIERVARHELMAWDLTVNSGSTNPVKWVEEIETFQAFLNVLKDRIKKEFLQETKDKHNES